MRKMKTLGSRRRTRFDVPYIYEIKVRKYARKIRETEEKEKKHIGRVLQKYMR